MAENHPAALAHAHSYYKVLGLLSIASQQRDHLLSEVLLELSTTFDTGKLKAVGKGSKTPEILI